jgi:uncharacterized membrane protein
MAAFVFIVTFFLSAPIPGFGGQAVFDAGDIAIFISSFTFGPIVGAMSGGLGSALSDAAYASYYAPFTLIVKGLEGLLAGYVVSRGIRRGELLGWFLGSVAMVLGYFLTNLFLIGLVYGASSDAAKAAGLTVAFGELPFDVVQVVAGGIIGIPVARKLRAALPVGLLPHRAPK